jgi:hypothetical protein
MSMSVQDIRNYVRGFIDVDVTDIPDLILDQWTADGYNRMMRSERPWPFFMVGGTESQYTITTVVGQQSYPLPGVSVQGASASVPVRNLVSIQGPHWELGYSDQAALESTFPAAFIQSAEPERYSIWANKVTLWPIPNSAYLLNIRAYREPVDWVSLGAGGVVDAPDDFHMVLTSYVLAQGWAQQTDLEQASFWLTQFEKGVQELKNNWIRSLMPQGMVLNGGRVTRELEPRLRFPFEGLGTTD